MRRTWATRLSLVIVSLAFAASAAQAQLGATVTNWPVPSSSSGSSSRGIRALADVTNPLPFIGVTPCRIVDTRGPAGTFGGPSLPGGTPRNFPLPTGPCAGIPASVSAYSLNITVTNTLGPGFILLYPTGGAQPLVSTLNYIAGQTIANAAIVPAGTSGAVTVIAGVSGTDLIIDINGYYGPSPATTTNPFVVNSAAGTDSAAIIGNNSSTASLASGVLGQITSSSPGVSSAGVRGVNLGTGSNGFGVLGTHNGSGYGVWGVSSSGLGVYGSSFGSGIGVYGESVTGIGVQGLTASTTGLVYGVRGTSFSTTDNSAGVIGTAQGIAEGAAPLLPTGVRGESTKGNGMVGLINPGSGNSAVAGFLYDTIGGELAAGRLGYAAGPIGVNYSGGLGGSGTKSFFEPHPTDATKMIRYISIEGPEAGVYFRGTGTTVDGFATIPVPETFRTVTDEEGLTVQLTPTGRQFTMMIVQSADLNTIVVRSSKDVTFHYLVQGVRRAYKDVEVVTRNFHFVPESPDAKIPASLSSVERRRLIENGTYNPDGTVNMSTAERAGWAADWKKQTDEAARRPANQVKAVGIVPPTRN